MAEHPDVERFRRALELRSRADLDSAGMGLLEDLLADDVVWHGAPGNEARGRDAVGRLWNAAAREAGQGLAVNDVYADGAHTVAALDVSGNGQSLSQAAVFHLNDEGKVTEFWSIPADTAVADALARNVGVPDHPNLPVFRTAEETRGRNTFEPQDLDNINAFLREDVRWISPWGEGPGNRDQVIEQFKAFKDATGGTIHMEIYGVFADGAHALSFVELTATRPDKPDRHLDLKEVNLFHLDADGRAFEFWGIQDDPAATEAFWAP